LSSHVDQFLRSVAENLFEADHELIKGQFGLRVEPDSPIADGGGDDIPSVSTELMHCRERVRLGNPRDVEKVATRGGIPSSTRARLAE